MKNGLVLVELKLKLTNQKQAISEIGAATYELMDPEENYKRVTKK